MESEKGMLVMAAPKESPSGSTGRRASALADGRRALLLDKK